MILQGGVMQKQTITKLIHVEGYAAEVEVEQLRDDKGWSPYLSIEEALKLDRVREALRQGDLSAAAQLATVYKLSPIEVA
jgi:hypothetical protein